MSFRRRIINRCQNILRTFAYDTRGSLAPISAVGLIVIFAAGALGVDYVRATALQRSLSMTADAAALAAASALPNADAARSIALEYAEKNMPSSKYGNVLTAADIEIGSWDSDTRTFTPAGDQERVFDGTAVRVTTRAASANGNQASTFFASVVGTEGVDVSISAVAGRGGPPCVLALDPVLAPSLSLSGNVFVETIGCGVQANSTAVGAFSATSSTELQTNDICVAGTADVGRASLLSVEPTEYCVAHNDPLAGLETPIYGGCLENNASYVDVRDTLSPGVYCGGLEIAGESEITLSAGLYIIRDGPLHVLDNAGLRGNGVTIFLTGETSLIYFGANSTISLGAPESGDLEGILIFQDPRYTGLHEWHGNSSAFLRGVIYLPTASLASKSTNSITPENACTVLIANDMTFAGNSGLSIDVTSANCRNALPGPYKRGITLLQ